MKHTQHYSLALLLVVNFASGAFALADSETTAMIPRSASAAALRSFSEQEMRDFRQLASSFDAQQLMDARSAQLVMALNHAIGELKGSMLSDDRQQSAFSQENLRAHLFAAQEAAENVSEIILGPPSVLEVASTSKR